MWQWKEIIEVIYDVEIAFYICTQLEPANRILNGEVSANAILKRATKHYTVVIKPLPTA